MHWLSFLESMRGVVVAKLTSRTGEPQETTSSRKIRIPCTNLDCILKMKQQQHDINLRRIRKKNPSPRWDLNPRPSVILIGHKIFCDQSEAGKSKCFWNCFGKSKFSRGSPVLYMIYACSYFVREYFMSTGMSEDGHH